MQKITLAMQCSGERCGFSTTLTASQQPKVCMGTLAAQFTDSAIGAYQRYLSPYKGFCCAYRAHTGKRSCSSYGRAIVQRLGLLAFLAALPRQFERCKLAYQKLLAKRTLMSANAVASDSKKKKNNDCGDCAPSPCDLLDAASSLPCDAAPCDCSF